MLPMLVTSNTLVGVELDELGDALKNTLKAIIALMKIRNIITNMVSLLLSSLDFMKNELL